MESLEHSITFLAPKKTQQTNKPTYNTIASMHNEGS